MHPVKNESLPTGNSFGERLRWIRRRSGLSLQRFGALIGFDQSYLSRLERGKAVQPSTDFVRAVCAEFLVEQQWLELGIGDPSQRVQVDLESAHAQSLKVSAQADDGTFLGNVDFTQVWLTPNNMIIALLMNEMTTDQLLTSVQRLCATELIPIEARLAWAKIIGEKALAKLKLEAKVAPQKGSEVLPSEGK